MKNFKKKKKDITTTKCVHTLLDTCEDMLKETLLPYNVSPSSFSFICDRWHHQHVLVSPTVEGEGMRECQHGNVPAVVVNVGIHKRQVAAVVNDGLHLRNVGVDRFVVDGAQEHTPAIYKTISPGIKHWVVIHALVSLSPLSSFRLCCTDTRKQPEKSFTCVARKASFLYQFPLRLIKITPFFHWSKNGSLTHSGKQWAAETIQRSEIMDPPHWWTPSYCRLTCQGQLPCRASTPPTIRSAAKLRLPQSAEERGGGLLSVSAAAL